MKKGTRSAEVARQYTGTAGRIENSQIGVFLTYATAKGRTFLDRKLYLPKAWTDDGRRHSGDTEIRHKTRTGHHHVSTRALDTGVPARWVTGDAVYGQYCKLRKTLEDRT